MSRSGKSTSRSSRHLLDDVAYVQMHGSGTRPTERTITVRTPAPPKTRMRSRCWCERTDVDVTAAEVRAGITHSCGRPGCIEPKEAP